jgi:hypothetical protein
MNSLLRQIDPDEQLQAYLRSLRDEFRGAWKASMKRRNDDLRSDIRRGETARARFEYVIDGSRKRGCSVDG